MNVGGESAFDVWRRVLRVLPAGTRIRLTHPDGRVREGLYGGINGSTVEVRDEFSQQVVVLLLAEIKELTVIGDYEGGL